MITNTLPIRILHVTDLHLFGAQHQEFLGVNPYNHFIAALQQLKQNQTKVATKLLLLGGDISQDYSAQSYDNVFQALAQAKLAVQVTAIPGNHDEVNVLRQSMLQHQIDLNKSIAMGNWQIILLNSHWSEHVAGRLDRNELDFLQSELDKNRDRNIIIFMHHHILSTNTKWVDKINLSNDEDFLATLTQYNNIKAVISGHVHFASMKQFNHIYFYTTPALAWQFMPGLDYFKLDPQMPGYRIIDLLPDGKYETKVMRLDYNDKFIPDLNTEGY